MKLWKPDNVDNIELFSANLIDYSFSKHLHETYTVGITYIGQGSFYYRGENRKTFPGSINFVNPGETHTGERHKVCKHWRYSDFYFSPSLVEKILNEMGVKNSSLPIFQEKEIINERLWKSIHFLFTEISSNKKSLSVEVKLIQLFSELIQKYSDLNYEPPKVFNEKRSMQIAKDFLAENYSQNISIEELSKVVNLSSYYFIRSFSKYYGLPPHQFQNQLRLQRAKKDLLMDESIASIALKNGFYDQSHFNRQFRKTFGVTPNSYRKGNSVQ